MLALVLLPAAPAAAAPSPGTVRAIAGPSSSITALSGMSIARDGTGAVVFLAQVGGRNRVFVSRLLGGVFQSPERVDGSLPGASSEPVVAAGNQGVLLVAFVNSGNLYVTEAPGADSAWNAPLQLHAAASNPSIQMSNFGKAYVAFRAAGDGGSDVRAEYFYNGAWAPVSAPLNVTPGDDAGTGEGAPVVATAGDGIGIVAWGESGHVYARRISGTSPSVVDEQLDPTSVGGATEVSASSPAIATGGNSSYVDIAFDELVKSGTLTRTRVLMTRLVSADTVPAMEVDGLSDTGGDSAGSPSVAMGEYGRGFALAVDQTSGHLMGTPLTANGYPASSPEQVDADGSTSPIYAVPGIAGANSTFVAWQQSPLSGAPQIVLRYGNGGTALGSPMVLSGGATGTPDAADGFAAAGDNGGDVAVAWAQDSAGTLAIDAGQLYQAPGAPNPIDRKAYARRDQPLLSWSPAAHRWGPITYAITLDGAVVGHTTATQFQVPVPLIDGPHKWQVTAVNPGGVQTSGYKANWFVDTTPPALRISLSGRLRAGHQLSLRVHARDLSASQPGAKASGLASVSVSWGDHTSRVKADDIRHIHHIYARKGRYVITVRATDRAGNTTTLKRSVRVLAATRRHARRPRK